MRTIRPLAFGTAFLVIVMLLGCRDNPPTGPSTPTPTPDPDVTAPLVSLSSPSDEAEVSGTIALMAGASDNVGVAGVQFLIDDEPYGPEVQFGPYRVNFDTRAGVDGAHIVTVRARDAAGLTGVSQPVRITVLNEPGIVELTVEAPDGFEDADGFQLLIDGVPVHDIPGPGTFTITDVRAGTRELSLAGFPPGCGSTSQTVSVRSGTPVSVTLGIGCWAEPATN